MAAALEVVELGQRRLDVPLALLDLGPPVVDLTQQVAQLPGLARLLVVNLRVGSALPPQSALYSALGLPPDRWAVASYPERSVTTLAIALFANEARALSLGLSVNGDDYDAARIEGEVLPLMRDERDRILRLMHLGEV